jgi:hypothetical protein
MMQTADRTAGAVSSPTADPRNGARPERSRPAKIGRVAEAAALPLIVVAGTVLAALFSLRADEWRVMTDELLYLRIAENIGSTLSPVPHVHGVRLQVYSLLYPVLIAPVVRVFDLPTAVDVVHGLNALLMASTAIPAYLLTRWMAPRSRIAAPAVAALTVFVPWLSFSLSVMTEAVAYPMVVWAVYGMVRAVAEPSVKADVLALVGLAGATLARTQFVFLFALFPVAVVLHEVGFRLAESRGGGRLAALRTGIVEAVRRHAVLWAVVAFGLLLLLAGVNVYGSYRSVVDTQSLWPPGMGQKLVDHFNEIGVGIGIVPLALTLALVAHTLLRPRANARVHAFAVVALLVVPAIAVIAAAFNITSGGILTQERYSFYIVPFLFAGAAACLTVHRPPLAVMVTAGAFTALMILQTTYHYPVFPPFASPTKFAYAAFDFRADQVGRVLGFDNVDVAPVAAMLGFAALFATALAAARGRGTAALGALACVLCAWGLVLFFHTAPKVLTEHDGLADYAFGADRPEPERTWIDRAAGESASVGMVPFPINARDGKPATDGMIDQAVWWDVEFWNKSVDRTFELAPHRSYTPFPELGLRVNPQTGALLPSSGGVPERLVLASTDVRFAPVARSTTVSPSGDVTLYELERPARAAWSTDAYRIDGSFPAARGTELTLYPSGRRAARRIEVLLDRGGGSVGEYRITGPGVRSRGRFADYRTVRFEACVPARRRWIGRIDLPGAGAARLASVKVVSGGPCAD